jgi:VWFA-related protein
MSSPQFRHALQAVLVRRAGPFLSLLLIAPGALATAEQEPAQQSQPASSADKPAFTTGTATVVLDVVVRDKKGRPVTDLRPDEIEVAEDGIRQTIEGFKRIETLAPTVEGAAAPVQPDATRQLSLVTLVFDQLGESGRRQAQRGAEAFLERGLRGNTYVAVFRVDQRLSMVQAFTNDRAKLKGAIASSTSGTFTGITDDKAALERATNELQQLAGLDNASGPGAASQGGGFAARAQAQALSNMLRMAKELQRQQNGTTSLYPLIALVKGQQTLAGRKTMLYFTERLDVPPNLDAVFRSVISEANRANVSVYAIDARGLSAEQEMADARAALDDARNASQSSMTSRGSGPVSKEQVKVSETAQGALRASVEGVLRDLAEGTGGFVIANTNNFKPGAEKIAADIASYYQLSYVPPPGPFDGRFRKIAVKVSREDVVVQARSGYFALPPGESQAVFPYEVPLLGALGVKAPPRDFEVRAAALRFGPQPGGFDHKVVVEVPISALKMNMVAPVPPATTGTYSLHLSLVALVKGEGGDVVERFSEDYPFEGPADKAEALKAGNIVFKRRLALPPGRYTLEVAGQDRETGKITTRRTPFEVPAAGAGPGMSSLALIRRIDQLPPDTKSDDPLDIVPARIVPNLDAPISLATNAKLWLFFIAYPAKGAEPPRMTLEFVKDGKPLRRAEVALPAPDADGNVRYIGNFPTSVFTPGTYDVKVGVTQAGATVSDRASLTLVP